jgi:hypothetical protein
MKKIILFLLVLFFSVTGFGRTVKRNSVQHYAMFKNKAELCIVDSNYAVALRYYKTAFHFKTPDQRDLYNAFIVAYLETDSAAIRSFYNQMILHGQPGNKLAILKFGKMHKDQLLYQWATKDYDSLRTIAMNGVMPQYARIMDSVFKADQDARVVYRNLSKEQLRIMGGKDSVNLDYLKQLIAEKGFPGYQQTGMFEKAQEGWIHSNSTIFFILWHTRDLSTLLDAMTRKAVLSGDFPPEDYAIIMDSRTANNQYFSRLPKNEAEDGQEFAVIPEDQEKAINKKRAAIQLCNLKDYKRKLEYQNTTNLFYFYSGMHMALVFSQLSIQ